MSLSELFGAPNELGDSIAETIGPWRHGCAPPAVVIDFGQITPAPNKVLVPTANMDDAHEF
jgi:hypothetical protein